MDVERVMEDFEFAELNRFVFLQGLLGVSVVANEVDAVLREDIDLCGIGRQRDR